MSVSKVVQLEEVISPFLGKNKKIIGKTVTYLTEPGENYGGTMLKVDLCVKEEHRNEKETINVVAKLIPESELFQKVFNIHVTFKSEIAFYKTIIPTLQNFQKESGDANVVDCFPKIYGERINLNGSDKVDKEAIILLENLKEKGYGNINRRVGCDYETTKIILENLAKLHAVSLALKLLKPKTFNEKVKPYLLCFVQDKININSHENAKKVIRSVVENSHCQMLLPEVNKSLEGLHKTVKEFREPFATLVHRDFWINNVMVKFANNKPEKSMLLDFQNYSYDSPAKDLLFFLATSVQTQVLQKNFDAFIQDYYKYFAKTLEDLKCPKTNLSFEEFIKEVAVSAGPEIGHIAFFLLLIVYGKTSPMHATKDDVEPEAKDRFFWILQEFLKKNWLNV